MRKIRAIPFILALISLVLIGPGIASSQAAPASPATAGASTADPASANPSTVLAGCPDGSACLFQNSNGGGQLYTTSGEDSTLHNNLCQGCISTKHPNSANTWGDQASSWQNRTTKVYCVYQDTNFNGVIFMMPPNSAVTNLDSADNDEASSIRPC